MILNICICYAQEDKKYGKELFVQLYNLRKRKDLYLWTEKDIGIGTKKQVEIEQQLYRADIVVVLKSAYFAQTEYYACIERLKISGKLDDCLIPVNLYTTDSCDELFEPYKSFPSDKECIKGKNRAQLWQDLVGIIQEKIQEKQSKPITIESGDTYAKEHMRRVAMSPPSGIQVLARHETIATLKKPQLVCLALDVSECMKQPIIDASGNFIRRWDGVSAAIEQCLSTSRARLRHLYLQKKQSLDHVIIHGFGFREGSYGYKLQKRCSARVRELLVYPTISSPSSVEDRAAYWSNDNDQPSMPKAYDHGLFGSTALIEILTVLRTRLRDERRKKIFAQPILLLVIADGSMDRREHVLPLIEELRALGACILVCYLVDKGTMVYRQLYHKEQAYWSEGAKLLFACASELHETGPVMQMMVQSLQEGGWNPQEGARLFACINQVSSLTYFLELVFSELHV